MAGPAKTIDKSWSLFLDRDGVINTRRFNDYVKSWGEFIFLPDVPQTISQLSKVFGRIFVVTNQQGIGKGIMDREILQTIHDKMQAEVSKAGGRIDAIYYCPDLAEAGTNCRKPEIGMAEQAKSDFPDTDFNKSIMVGDSQSDIQFGKNAHMRTIFVTHSRPVQADVKADYYINSLAELPSLIDEINL